MSHIIPQSELIKIHQLVEEHIGLASHRQSTDALEEIILNLSQGQLENYYHTLMKSQATAPIWQKLVDALTIGETYFLRDKVHFQVLRDHIFPQLFEARRAKRKLKIWSVGCATGEEPYSLAITLKEVLPDAHNWDVDILGSDLNENALRFARSGVYRQWAFRHTSEDFQQTYFEDTPIGLKIRPEIQKMVRFQQANLLSESPIEKFDLVLCRNVLIYFGVDSRRKTERLLRQSVAADGWLLLGHSETLRHEMRGWILDQFPGLPIYQRKGTSTAMLPQKVPQAIRKTLTAELPVLSIISENGIESRYQKAVEAIHDEAYDLAEALTQKIINEDPNHAPSHTLLGAVHANRGQHQLAHKHLDAALYRDPLVADAHYLRALLYMEAEREQEAHRALVAALYCQQHHPLASFSLGNLYARSGDLRRANHYWQNTLQALSNRPGTAYISDISQITVEQVNKLVRERLKDWE